MKDERGRRKAERAFYARMEELRKRKGKATADKAAPAESQQIKAPTNKRRGHTGESNRRDR